nr:DUF938 domain-containing protein [Candidatus Nitrosoglobus terrae]
MKYFSQACENNKQPILEILKRVLKGCHQVLEIGSGSGQHAVYFGKQLPHLTWQPTETLEGIAILKENLVSLSAPSNVLTPLVLDVNQPLWPLDSVANIFSANTLHILAWEEVELFFKGVGALLKPKGLLCVYGPFRYQGNYTSLSNAEFDSWLKAQDVERGIRDFEAVNTLAEEQGLELKEDYAMPANNQFLIWQRSEKINS